jgi:hypothetical protein
MRVSFVHDGRIVTWHEDVGYGTSQRQPQVRATAGSSAFLLA